MNNKNLKVEKNLIIDLSTLLLFISIFALRKVPILMYIAQIIFIIVIFLKIKQDGVKINNYILFSFIFVLWTIMSIYWSPKPSTTIRVLKPLIQITVLCMFFVQYFIRNSMDKIDKVLKYFCFSSFVLVIMIFFNTSTSEWGEIIRETSNISSSKGRLGPSVGYHTNALGTVLSFSALICLYLDSKYKQKKYNILYGVLAVLVVFTKSRKSFITLTLGSILYLAFYKKRDFRKVLLSIPMLLLILIGIYWSIFNIPFLYKIIGFRMEGLLTIFNTSDVVDASTVGRGDMIRIAIDLFKQNPITGVGMGNFSYYYYYVFGGWAETYSHSNYFEILSGLGVVGFITHYFILFNMIYTMIIKRKIFFKYDRKLSVFIVIFLLIRIIMDYGMVSYDDEFIQLLTVTLYCGMCSLNFFIKNESKNKVRIDYRTNRC